MAGDGTNIGECFRLLLGKAELPMSINMLHESARLNDSFVLLGEFLAISPTLHYTDSDTVRLMGSSLVAAS